MEKNPPLTYLSLLLHGLSISNINGLILLAESDFEKACLQIHANDIYFNEQFSAALPEGLQPFYSKLVPTGRFDLDLKNLEISKHQQPLEWLLKAKIVIDNIFLTFVFC